MITELCVWGSFPECGAAIWCGMRSGFAYWRIRSRYESLGTVSELHSSGTVSVSSTTVSRLVSLSLDQLCYINVGDCCLGWCLIEYGVWVVVGLSCVEYVMLCGWVVVDLSDVR